MRFSLIVVIVFGLMVSCDTWIVSPNKLVGKWDSSYQIQEKDADGKWSDWITINTFVALPQVEFTEDGKILFDGIPSEQCCSYLSYELKGKRIKFSDFANTGENCATVDCYLCDSWTIEKLTDKVLEVNSCENNKIRYLRAE
jgi:hypothetical protein